MSHPSHLLCRNGWYYLRFHIPRDLVPIIGRKEVCKALKAQDRKSAQNLREIYMAQANQIFLLARSNMLNTQAQKAIEQHNNYFLQVCELLKCTDNLLPMRAPAQNDLVQMINKYQQALARQDYTIVAGEVALLCEEHKLELLPTSGKYKVFCRELLKAKIESCQKEMLHLQGIYGQPVPIQSQQVSADNTEKLNRILSLVTEADKPLFSTVVDSYLLNKSEAERMEERVIKEYRSQFNFIMRVIESYI